MAELLVQSDSLTAIADAIREKAESTDPLVFPTGFIDALSNIGGLPNGITALASGQYTPVSDVVGAVDFEHGFGFMPNFAILCVEGQNISEDNYAGYLQWQIIVNKTFETQIFYLHTYSNKTNGLARRTSEQYGGMTDEIVRFYQSGTNKFKGGQTYRWVAAYIEGI